MRPYLTAAKVQPAKIGTVQAAECRRYKRKRTNDKTGPVKRNRMTVPPERNVRSSVCSEQVYLAYRGKLTGNTASCQWGSWPGTTICSMCCISEGQVFLWRKYGACFVWMPGVEKGPNTDIKNNSPFQKSNAGILSPDLIPGFPVTVHKFWISRIRTYADFE